MTIYLNDKTYDRLLTDLAGAFTIAATNTDTDLHDQLVAALAGADLMPESCRADFEAMLDGRAAA